MKHFYYDSDHPLSTENDGWIKLADWHLDFIEKKMWTRGGGDEHFKLQKKHFYMWQVTQRDHNGSFIFTNKTKLFNTDQCVEVEYLEDQILMYLLFHNIDMW